MNAQTTRLAAKDAPRQIADTVARATAEAFHINTQLNFALRTLLRDKGIRLLDPVEIARAEAAAGQPLSPRATLLAAIRDVEHWRALPAATVIDHLIRLHGACGAYNPNSVQITCAGADGTGETEADALHQWTLRARYLLTEGAI